MKIRIKVKALKNILVTTIKEESKEVIIATKEVVAKETIMGTKEEIEDELWESTLLGHISQF